MMDYQIVYDRLMQRSHGRVINGYTERHHILPRCLGGGDEETNIAVLTAEEHYVAHQLLVKLHPTSMSLLGAAFFMTTNQISRAGNKPYGWLRRRSSAMQTGQKRPFKPKSREHVERQAASQRGKIISEEQRAAIRKKLIGTKASAETRAKLSARRSGRLLSPEHSAKIGAALRGKTRPASVVAKVAATRKANGIVARTVEAMNAGRARKRMEANAG